MSEKNTASVDDILDGTLDDIEDLPSFSAWPAGAYRVTLPEGFAQKKINDKPAFEVKLKNLEVLEVTNPAEQEEAPKVGDETSLSFMMDNETGKGFFKEAIMPFVAHAGLDSKTPGAIRTAVAASKGLECLVILKRTKKEDKQTKEIKVYAKLAKIEVL